MGVAAMGEVSGDPASFVHRSPPFLPGRGTGDLGFLSLVPTEIAFIYRANVHLFAGRNGLSRFEKLAETPQLFRLCARQIFLIFFSGAMEYTSSRASLHEALSMIQDNDRPTYHYLPPEGLLWDPCAAMFWLRE